MTDLVLHHTPGACSQVAVCALEMAAIPYRLELVDQTKNAQSSPEYLAKSPLGKVPLLVIDGVGLSENAAILTYIAALAPDAGIFPADPAPRGRAEAVGGLSFCGATLHPIVRGLANPARLTTGDGDGVREQSRNLANKSFGYAERRLAERGWWLGAVSIVDVYLNWAFSVARNARFDTAPFPHLDALGGRLADALPAFRAMQAEESASRAALGMVP